MAAEAKSNGGKANLIVTAAALTVLALIGGGLVGKLIVTRLRGATAPVAATSSAAPVPYSSTVAVRELAPIIVNLASPPDSRIRLQVALVFTKGAIEEPAVMAAQINGDIVAFLKTLSLTELQGASGLQALREDLNERAATRSQGKVREVIIEALVVE